MKEKNKVLELLHTKIHALRMMPNYKPTIFEIEFVKIITEEFKDDCEECKEKALQYKYNPPQQSKGFLGGIFK